MHDYDQEEQLIATMVVRMFPEEKRRIQEYAQQHARLYDNPSHVVRCAIQRFLREEVKPMKNPHEYRDESSTLFTVARNLSEEARP